MTNDSTQVVGPLAKEVLQRLDAVAAQMGVAANEVWSIWLATSWRPMLDTGSTLVIGLLMVLSGCWALRKAYQYDRENVYNDVRPPMFGVPGGFFALVGIIAFLIALTNLPDAITYLAEPRLYALDQLRGLVGK